MLTVDTKKNWSLFCDFPHTWPNKSGNTRDCLRQHDCIKQMWGLSQKMFTVNKMIFSVFPRLFFLKSTTNILSKNMLLMALENQDITTKQIWFPCTVSSIQMWKKQQVTSSIQGISQKQQPPHTFAFSRLWGLHVMLVQARLSLAAC